MKVDCSNKNSLLAQIFFKEFMRHKPEKADVFIKSKSPSLAEVS